MNLAEIRKRIEDLNNRTKKAGKFWRPKDEHDVRLLPQKGSEDPFIERTFHGNIGTQWPVLCPKNFGEECSVCELAEKLRSWKDEEGNDKPDAIRKKDWELFKKIQAKPKFFVALVERGKEAYGPAYWQFTEYVYKQILSICGDEENNENRDDEGGAMVLVSPTNAYDLHVSLQKAGQKGNATKFDNTEVKEKKKTSKLLADKAEAKKLLESVPSLDDVLPPVSAKEVHKTLMSFINGGAGADASADAGKEDVEYSGASEEKVAVKSNNAEKLKGKKSIDEAFDDLANS